MNRLIIVLTLLLAATAARADYEFPNYFAMGENDTLQLAAGSDTVTVPVRAHFVGGVSSWTLKLTYPEGLTPAGLIGGPDLAVPYLDSQGEQCIYNAAVTATLDMTTITSTISVAGYMPYGGGYFSFGAAMWKAGDYAEMFDLVMVADEGFAGGLITIDGRMTGDTGPYGLGVGVAVCYKEITVVLTRVPGDVNGDGVVNIADVTTLINRLLTGAAIDAIDDVNGDGTANIGDVTALINRLLTHD